MTHGVARGDQGQVWAAIEERAERLQAPSATNAMADIFEAQAHSIESYVEHLPLADNQIGAVFLLDGQPVGVDLLDSVQAFRRLMPKILRGYALDAIDRRFTRDAGLPAALPPPVARARTDEFIQTVLTAPRQAFPSIGLGETYRLYAPRISGGALMVDGHVIHLSAFAS
jgi:hypothetical protein